MKSTITKINPALAELTATKTGKVIRVDKKAASVSFESITMELELDPADEKTKGLKVGDEVVYDDNWDLKEVVRSTKPATKTGRPQSSYYTRSNG